MISIDSTAFEKALEGLAATNLAGYQQLKFSCLKVDPLAWLNQQLHTVRGYWSEPSGAHTAFVGQACDLLSPEQLQNACESLNHNDDSLRFYGGMAFSRRSAQWPGFPQRRFVLPRFELRQNAQLSEFVINADFHNNPRQEIELIRSQFYALQDPHPLPPLSCQLRQYSYQPNFERWQKLVDEVTAPSFQAHTAKVVLARQTQIKLDRELNPFTLIDHWQKREQQCYSFVFQFDGVHSFVGCSPERLYSRDGLDLRTEALAGTAPRHIDPAQDIELANRLLEDDKNQRENQIVVDDLVRRLQEISLHVQPQAHTELLRLRRVQHLKRPIHATISPDLDDSALLSTLHPTPAVGGLPRSSAMRFIEQKEGFDRGWYSGAVGWFSGERSEFSVAIRSALLSPTSLNTYAGAGIVEGSQAQEEWDELNHKTAALLDLLQLDLDSLSA
ncbi:isochorismate synthase [Alginatibacterium sediminis]|uniref:Isochorismate synthase MenF n=1 Tax=Alginatibacterium sediminis TaxID=2164068 RepID=A0A420E705_9ALTE|nr:isochorismate synthase [Alginatibacterium sediminis]RKF14321.1 isochorismate synthase [Alginatibacterium sediminis]